MFIFLFVLMARKEPSRPNTGVNKSPGDLGLPRTEEMLGAGCCWVFPFGKMFTVRCVCSFFFCLVFFFPFLFFLCFFFFEIFFWLFFPSKKSGQANLSGAQA